MDFPDLFLPRNCYRNCPRSACLFLLSSGPQGMRSCFLATRSFLSLHSSRHRDSFLLAFEGNFAIRRGYQSGWLKSPALVIKPNARKLFRACTDWWAVMRFESRILRKEARESRVWKTRTWPEDTKQLDVGGWWFAARITGRKAEA